MKEVLCYSRNRESSSHLLLKAERTHYKKKRLKVQIIENGYVLVSKGWDSTGRIVSGGVVDKDKSYIPESAYADGLSCGYEFDDNTIDTADTCIYIGILHNCFGHGLTDTQKKLWFLKTPEGQKFIEEGTEIVYLTTANTEISSWHLHLIELAGIDISKIKHIRNTTKYRQIIIPENSIWRKDEELYYCDEFKETINQIKQNVEHSTAYNQQYPSYIYFTRTAINDVWREMGEKSLENYFRRMGYSIISPEKHSLEQQISMLMKCQHFAATEGSCSHGALFCNPDSEVTILRKADYVNRYSIAIADFADCKTAFVDANRSILCHKDYPWRGPFYLTVTKELKEYAGLKNGIFYLFRFTYWLYLCQRSFLGKKLLYYYYLFLILRQKLKKN